jgi:hypothetical protein
MENESPNAQQLSEQSSYEIKKLEVINLLIKDNLPSILKYFEDQRIKHTTPVTKLTISSFLIIIAIILIASSVLVYIGKPDSSAFTFIIGTTLGYLFGISKFVLNQKDE